jgi:hypothetical protein
LLHSVQDSHYLHFVLEDLIHCDERRRR